ncbi:MAG: KH domain-containing protein [Eggerthellales bacterium]|nr:KH domain-containing protein [Eggerthellales bacterium]
MTQQTSDIASLVRVIVEPLVEDKEAVSVSSMEAEDGALIVEIRVNPEDVGKVIGRQGRVIKSIRVLARAAYGSDGRDVEVELIED